MKPLLGFKSYIAQCIKNKLTVLLFMAILQQYLEVRLFIEQAGGQKSRRSLSLCLNKEKRAFTMKIDIKQHKKDKILQRQFCVL